MRKELIGLIPFQTNKHASITKLSVSELHSGRPYIYFSFFFFKLPLKAIRRVTHHRATSLLGLSGYQRFLFP